MLEKLLNQYGITMYDDCGKEVAASKILEELYLKTNSNNLIELFRNITEYENRGCRIFE